MDELPAPQTPTAGTIFLETAPRRPPMAWIEQQVDATGGVELHRGAGDHLRTGLCPCHPLRITSHDMGVQPLYRIILAVIEHYTVH